MAEYVPTAEEAKETYEMKLRFEVWLEKHDRSVAAKAWDEGHSHCFHVEDPKNRRPYNPYKESE